MNRRTLHLSDIVTDGSAPTASRGAPFRLPRADAQPRWRVPRTARIAIVASQFHQDIARALVRGAVEVLSRSGMSRRQIRLLWVPGAFELPVVAAHVARSRLRPHAIIALAAIIRGQTPQYAVLANAVAQGLSQVAVTTLVPVTFGVIVATTLRQATARAGGTMGNRGAEAARAALSILQLLKTLSVSGQWPVASGQ